MKFSLFAWLNTIRGKISPAKPQRPYHQTAEYYYRLQENQHQHHIEVSVIGEIIYCSPQQTAQIDGIKELSFEYKVAANIHPDETVCLFFSDLIQK